ncbi:gluconokinase [Waterburya agarophytonicola K14]|uniref:Gluconokinase n=1 Tax=Waterburya agarophytonicola KI4 TaxID=2874699 RepID=A0A964FIS4_9CYAN|nr:gluconokinase [Waterburya agarophytonicola]MCC0178679.1 gluconokinase [Waterburya agarophytonicola KI4]
MFYIVMGVSGSGKSTVGKLLSDRLNCDFYDGDDFHPPHNVDKMDRGIPLTDSDRISWLQDLRQLIEQKLQKGETGVLACSALKQKYRSILQHEDRRVIFIYLQGDYNCIRSRIEQRQGHFMKADLLTSQFAVLEEPANALVVDVSLSPETIVQQILNSLA